MSPAKTLDRLLELVEADDRNGLARALVALSAPELDALEQEMNQQGRGGRPRAFVLTAWILAARQGILAARL